MPAGRPTKYSAEFAEHAKALATNGATAWEIARALGVTKSTIYDWAAAYPEFSDALRVGREIADNRVERSLYERAVGYEFDAVKIMSYEGSVIVEPYVEHVPPDPNAAKFWLMNRQPDKWREKQSLALSNEGDAPLIQIYLPDNGRDADKSTAGGAGEVSSKQG